MAEIAQLVTPTSEDERFKKISPLMYEKHKAARKGEKYNACPYGCQLDDLDDHGYCRHLIGFSNDQKTFEPMFVDPHRGERIIRPRMEIIKGTKKSRDRLGNPGDIKRKPIWEEVKPTDKLIQITSSYRVYRDVDKVEPPPLPEDFQELVTPAAEEPAKNKK